MKNRKKIPFEKLSLILVLAALYVLFSFTAPNFLSSSNQLNILQECAFVGILAWGMTFVIIAAEIDISVGSAAALASALLGVLVVDKGLPMWFAVILVLLEATLFGFFNGFIRTRFNVPAFIVTLAGYKALKGAALLITNATPIYISTEGFSFVGSGRLFKIVPVPAVILVLTFFVFHILLTRTSLGRSVFAIGGNPEAARQSGIPVNKP
ncbi:MAG: ABC transporter permease [Coprococcus sp.]|nr:ABC transporter permease [Coprococcus sp.]